MNSLEAKIQSELMSAMKEKDNARMSALRSIKSAILQEKTAAGGKKDLEDADIIRLIQKLAKQREESMEIYSQNGRPELAANEKAEMEVLNTFLPKKLSEQETEELVKTVIEKLAATTMKDMGKVMGYINKEYSGQVDGATVSKFVKACLSGNN